MRPDVHTYLEKCNIKIEFIDILGNFLNILHNSVGRFMLWLDQLLTFSTLWKFLTKEQKTQMEWRGTFCVRRQIYANKKCEQVVLL